MYVPAVFKEERVSEMHVLMRQNPFGILVTQGHDGPTATHMPFVLNADPAPYGTLSGHLAKPNPQWGDNAGKGNALIIFQGPQRYISPSWYPTKNETGRVVPTWNYLAVHAYGKLEVTRNLDRLKRHLEELTDQQETGRPNPWKLTDAPDDFVETMLRGIVGVEIVISALQGKAKVSQNRSEADRRGVVDGLRELQEPEAQAMASLIAETLQGSS